MRVVIDQKGLNESNPEAGTSLNVHGNIIATGITVSGSLTLVPGGEISSDSARTLTGTIGARGGHGARPLATSVPSGTVYIGLDNNYVGIAIPHPHGIGKVWYPVVSIRQLLSLATAGNAVTARRLGFYDIGTNIFTQATASGQFCNANASGNTSSGSLVAGLNTQPGVLQVLSAVSTSFLPGDQIMTDASGFATLYVNNGTNVALGMITFELPGPATMQVPAILYDP